AVSSPPTAEELRRLAIWNNYRALIDPTPGGGYGLLYGPNVAADGTVTNSEGLIPGWETLALARVPSRHAPVAEIVTMMVQIPDSYDPAHGCIVTGASSGSRGVYGAIATAGEWGLKHGCAVAYTDKGTGTGAHDLHNDTVNLLRGERTEAQSADGNSNFTAPITESQRAAFDQAYPYRFAFKHAHSQANPEANWGRNVLESIRFAFYVLNQRFSPGQPHAINKRNTIVIASSVSNGGEASMRALEEDKDHLIDGLAVTEPNVNPVYDSRFVIQQGSAAPLVRHSRPLEDWATLENLYSGCAAVAQGTAAPLNLAASPDRCNALAAQGLLSATTTAGQAAEAQTILNDYGLLPEQNFVSPSHWFAYVYQSIAMTYTNAYGEFSVLDNLCGYSLGATATDTGAPVPLSAAAEATLFGTSNGIPPTGGVNLINNLAPGGPKEDRGSTPDQDLRGALCLRSLARDIALGSTPAELSPAQSGQTARVARGVADVLATGNLHGIPAIYASGRNDATLLPNFTGRAYYGLNQVVEGGRSNLHFYEVMNAQHLDTLNQFAGFNSTLIPLHRYFIKSWT
ncbi:MAG: D-(-)-3-hydroxybutyrate oligomer hydrolase, partial [Acetobacteraceae bacterium]|nr:D-(-)-3-hydroxybutyrate oligomer hydrolase [Acetobacteraceae bacterium]